jgi:hypothetical protein
VPLLVPGARARPAALRPWRISPRFVIAVSAVLLAALSFFPIALVAATKPVRGPDPDAFILNATLVPTSGSFAPSAHVSAGAVRLRWRPVTSSAGTTSYTIYRAPPNLDVVCGHTRHAPDRCGLYSQKAGTSRTTAFTDRPPPGTWVYRVGTTANWLDNPQFGDVYVSSGPVQVTVP